jgi:hypothetical protein
MFKNLCAENAIIGLIVDRDLGNLTDVIDGLKILHQLPLVLTKILCLVTTVLEVGPIFGRTRTGVQHATAVRKVRSVTLDPLIPRIRFRIPKAFSARLNKFVHAPLVFLL